MRHEEPSTKNVKMITPSVISTIMHKTQKEEKNDCTIRHKTQKEEKNDCTVRHIKTPLAGRRRIKQKNNKIVLEKRRLHVIRYNQAKNYALIYPMYKM